MRKGNIIAIALLLFVSFELLWLWDYLGFSRTDPADIVFVVLWWIVIIGVVVAIIVVEQRRRAHIRTILVSDDVIYNCEAGVVRLAGNDGNKDFVKSMRNVLNSLDYSSEARLSQDQPRVKFNYIVNTKKYSKGGQVWSGDVICVTDAQHAKTFSNAQELSRILTA